jgi:Mn2+/Fe2+ NRAMP family transporter
MTIVTLVGGTVGGYISFAGAHRLIDAGIKGPEHLGEVTRSSVSGILITGLMRFILFFAALGVVLQGVKLSAGNPAATVFQSAAGEIGYKFFGIVMWCAAMTSVVGASYTTISFWKTLIPAVHRHERIVISVFILCSTLIFIIIGKPVTLLVLAGAINGMILPIALAVVLLIARKSTLLSGYRHPLILHIIGWIVVVVMTWMCVLMFNV